MNINNNLSIKQYPFLFCKYLINFVGFYTYFSFFFKNKFFVVYCSRNIGERILKKKNRNIKIQWNRYVLQFSIYIDISLNLFTINMHMCKVFICRYMYIDMFIYSYMYVCMYVFMYTYIYRYICIHMHTYIYIHMFIITYL
jgi:hypothetical protein